MGYQYIGVKKPTDPNHLLSSMDYFTEINGVLVGLQPTDPNYWS